MKLAPDLSLKDLAPCDARMALSIARFAEEELKAPLRGRLLVALSGGADSTALLIILCALRPLLGCHVEAAHLDHGLRPESAEDALAAAVLCRDLGVPFHGGRADVAHLAQEYSCGVEEAGRRARYAFLEEARISSGADWTLTAHHVGDLAEDVLLRLARGAVWPGVGGMRARLEEPGRRVLRPLLMQEKRNLTAMLERLEVSWREDGSNASCIWKRNRMRHELLPLFLAENPAFFDSIRRLWRNARRDEAYWDTLLAPALELQTDGSLFIPGKTLSRWTKAERLRALAEAVRRMHCGQPLCETLERMDSVWNRRHFPRSFAFSGGLEAEVCARGIVFRKRS
ncbi:tRNA lysidine(34) synthetase TilS [uncultured Mailhella sp.]|uniref:tRNA lysidine(34) synthetase TilS n=1 Tax=uncultured Mailhella sp. TaxID=1981031 RepID=UPI002615F9AB|nr:tRNA lysidine(34) synthetase TilS [uncultured Mailhella sp.]